MPFAPETTNSVSDGFVEWSETNTQTDQFLGRVLGSHHPALFVLPDSDVKENVSKWRRNIVSGGRIKKI